MEEAAKRGALVEVAAVPGCVIVPDAAADASEFVDGSVDGSVAAMAG